MRRLIYTFYFGYNDRNRTRGFCSRWAFQLLSRCPTPYTLYLPTLILLVPRKAVSDGLRGDIYRGVVQRGCWHHIKLVCGGDDCQMERKWEGRSSSASVFGDFCGLLRAMADEGNNTREFCHISDCIRSAFDAVGLVQTVKLVSLPVSVLKCLGPSFCRTPEAPTLQGDP